MKIRREDLNFEPTQKLTFSVFFNHKKRTATKMKGEHNLILKEESGHFFRANKTNILDSDDQFGFFFFESLFGVFWKWHWIFNSSSGLLKNDSFG